jgi:undecaprenyl-diphosphatase
MTLLFLIHAFILGVIEGLTEFLPISSTGHLIIGAYLLNANYSNIHVFEIFIQLGAILAIVYEYRNLLSQKIISIKQRSSKNFFINLFLAFFPAAFMGLLFHDSIKTYLFNPMSVSLALIIGGLVILVIENSLKKRSYKSVEQISFKTALEIGLFQCFALIPGVSRSGATIMGGMLLNLNRKSATEFSFFLAIPIIFAASFYDLLKNLESLSSDDTLFFLIGFVTSFFSALIVIRFLIRFVATNDFKVFAYYRILIGILFLILFY